MSGPPFQSASYTSAAGGGFKELKQTLQLAGMDRALLAYLLLRFIVWHNKWKHQFMFTLVRAVLWNYFKLSSVVECCDTPRERHPMPSAAVRRRPASSHSTGWHKSRSYESTHKKGALEKQAACACLRSGVNGFQRVMGRLCLGFALVSPRRRWVAGDGRFSCDYLEVLEVLENLDSPGRPLPSNEGPTAPLPGKFPVKALSHYARPFSPRAPCRCPVPRSPGARLSQDRT